MAQFLEIEIDQGTDFSLDLGLKNNDGTYVNLNGYSFYAEMRKTHSSVSSVAQFGVDTETGSLILTLDAESTAGIKSGRYVFDVKQTNLDNNKISRLVEGIVNVNPQVTR